MRLFVLLYGLILSSTAFGFTLADSSLLKQKTITANRIQSEIKIDGELNEAEWQMFERGKNFIENFPVPGKLMRFDTEVSVLYDDEAIYIAAWLFDPSPDSILKQLCQRDIVQNSDLFGFAFDTYNDNQNTFEFSVQACGVQYDARASTNNFDENWNAVWLSEVKITDQGWVVEIKIPFSSLRFSSNAIQNWGINFTRSIRRFRENGHWSFTNPRIPGTANQFGDLTGIENLKSPLRLSLIPYTSVYYDRYDDNSSNVHDGAFAYNAGLDLKYGLNDAFTLDMTLVPDFGQVQSDNIVFNTSPFEVQFNEFRQFFTEGTELFNKAGIFYSRRIGGFPINYGDAYNALGSGETILKNPSTTKTLNATKLSGRTQSGLGIGLFNGISAETNAELQDSLGNIREVETNPLTNYNVLVLDQNLKNNSYINFTNGSVMRNGSTYDANVTSLKTNLNTPENKYGVTAGGIVSQKYNTNSNVDLGHSAFIQAGKYYGNFTADIVYRELSDTYDPNDIGFLLNNNRRSLEMFFKYNTFEPKGIFLKTNTTFNVYQTRLYTPNVVTETGFFGRVFGNTRKWIAQGLEFNFVPFLHYDYFEPRVAGRFLEKNKSIWSSYFISTDYRKKFAIDVFLSGISYINSDWSRWNLRISPRFRVNDKLMLLHTTSFTKINNENASALTRSGRPTIFGDTIIFSKRDGNQVENILQIRYTFTNKMALTIRTRHYWYSLDYNSFHILNTNGNLSPTTYTGSDISGKSLHDNNFNAFNIDLVYTWVFAPGSELRFVWKSSIYSDLDSDITGYFDNLDGTLASAKTNSFSIKLLYFLDVNRFKRKKTR